MPFLHVVSTAPRAEVTMPQHPSDRAQPPRGALLVGAAQIAQRAANDPRDKEKEDKQEGAL